jgi:hypothetical protein
VREERMLRIAIYEALWTREDSMKLLGFGGKKG